MNQIINKVSIIGNLGKEVELIDFKKGSKRASVSVATTDTYKNNKGELKKVTQWHNVVAWGRNAELLAKVCKKGSKIALKGKINYRQYTNQDGEKRTITEIILSDFIKLVDSTSVVTRDPAPF